MTTDTIISKVWGFCTTRRDDGVGDYLEQLIYRIFLKMANERQFPGGKQHAALSRNVFS